MSDLLMIWNHLIGISMVVFVTTEALPKFFRNLHSFIDCLKRKNGVVDNRTLQKKAGDALSSLLRMLFFMVPTFYYLNNVTAKFFTYLLRF